jgi:hypothetical protein
MEEHSFGTHCQETSTPDRMWSSLRQEQLTEPEPVTKRIDRETEIMTTTATLLYNQSQQGLLEGQARPQDGVNNAMNGFHSYWSEETAIIVSLQA